MAATCFSKLFVSNEHKIIIFKRNSAVQIDSTVIKNNISLVALPNKEYSTIIIDMNVKYHSGFQDRFSNFHDHEEFLTFDADQIILRKVLRNLYSKTCQLRLNSNETPSEFFQNQEQKYSAGRNSH